MRLGKFINMSTYNKGFFNKEDIVQIVGLSKEMDLIPLYLCKKHKELGSRPGASIYSTPSHSTDEWISYTGHPLEYYRNTRHDYMWIVASKIELIPLTNIHSKSFLERWDS